MSQHRHLYNTSAWKRLRLHQLESQPLCRMHEQVGELVPASVADHITPHRGDRGLFFDPMNLQSLCKPCHDSHKQAQENNADGILRGAGHDGRPLDLAHPWHRQPAGDRGSNLYGSSAEDRIRTSVCKTAKLEGGA